MIHVNSSEKNIQTLTPPKKVTIASRVSPALSAILYPLGRYIVLPFYFSQISVTGQENLPRTGPVILAPTHRSRWDALIVPYAAGRYVSDRDLRFMVSANEMKGLQGWFIRRFGGFPIDTEQPGVGSFRHAVELLAEGEAIVIFPEGNIFRDDFVNPLKRGLARIALEVEEIQPEAKVQIVPMSIHYSQSVPQRGCDVTVKIGTPLQLGDYGTRSPRQVTKQLTTDLEVALKQLHEEKLAANDLPAEKLSQG